jgi:proton-translocating NADH-quinone oxidoreductase chain M
MLLFLAVFIPVILSVLSLLNGRKAAVLSVMSGAVSIIFLLLSWAFEREFLIKDWIPKFLPWVQPIEFSLRLDGISFVMCLATQVLFMASAVYSVGYIEKKKGEYYFFLMMLLTALLGVFTSSNLLAFYIFWEFMLIPSYFLIAWWGYGEAEKYAFKFFIFTHVGSLMIVLGLGIIYNTFGTLSMDAIYRAAPINALWREIWLLVFSLMTFGFLVKAGMFPVHSWLPDAHSEAPAPFSAMLSGILVATGIYAIYRISFRLILLPMSPDLTIPSYVAWLGIISSYFGAFIAMRHSDIKRIPAYSSISQLGYSLAGISLGTAAMLNGNMNAALLAYSGAFLHLFAHAWSKGLLFLTAGSVMHILGKRNIEEMGMILKRMPMTGGSTTVAAMSIAGAPPLPIFWGEAMMIVAAASSGIQYGGIFALLFAGATLLSAAYSLRYIYHVAWNPGAASMEKLKENKYMASAEIALSALTVALGAIPFILLPLLYSSL